MKNPLLDFAQQTAINLINQQRQRTIYQPMDYVLFQLPTQLPTLPQPMSALLRRVLGRNTISLLELDDAFNKIANDPRPKGVILQMGQLALSLADLQGLRASIARLRKRGKRVICYAQAYDLASYFVASAADEIWLQPSGIVLISGLAQQQVFLKDALNAVGLEADVIAISPYKSAADRITRTQPSEESDSQTNWLLDSTFAILTEAIAEGRNMPLESVHTLIDGAIYTDTQAIENQLIDYVCNEEGFQARLNTPHLTLWAEAEGRFLLQHTPQESVVAVLPIEGMIINGASNNPPVDIPLPFLGGQQAGDETIVQQVRHLMTQDNVKAVVVYVDSPGGSASASEAMASALDELAKTRPVVICMGGVAASGGYYVATSGQWIIAQPATITGSIGVFTLKLVTSGIWQKLRMNPFYYFRGANADFLLPIAPFTESQREMGRTLIMRIYEQFVGRVAVARKMKPETVDALGGGRVWTGLQAYEHGLVDQLGGLTDALDKARELAHLRQDAPVAFVRGRTKPLPAQLADKLDPAATLRHIQARISHFQSGQVFMLMPTNWRNILR